MTSTRWRAAAAALASTAALAACGGGSNQLQMVMFAPIVVEATSPGGAVVTVPSPAVTDSAGTATVTCTPAIGAGQEPLGTTNVTCNASDAAGNRASGTSTITVVDTTAPTLTMFAPITVVATSAAGAIATVPAPAASDLASTPSVSCNPAIGAGQFAIGTTTVSCTARDAAGNATTKPSTVTVLPAPAGPSGALDPGFGSAGAIITSPGPARAVAVQPDGKIVVLAMGPFSNGNSFTVMRFNADGSLDASFGTAGRAPGNLGGVSLAGEEANSLVLQADGKIVVGGNGSQFGSGGRIFNQFALSRFDASGALDTSFGSAGTVLISFSSTAGSRLYALALQPDGKLIAAGATPGLHNGYNFALARVLGNGTLDPAFGLGGTMVNDFSGLENDNSIESVALQSDGKIVAAGWNQLGGGGSDVVAALMRYNADGSIDTGFGLQGKISTTLVDNYGGPASVAVQPDGKIVLAKDVDTRNGDFALSRYNADGTADTSFGAGGVVSTDFGGPSQDRGYAMKLQGDGRIVVGGFTSSPKGSLFALVRYRTDGSLDPAFGTAGLASADLGATFNSELVRALAIQADGGIVAVGDVSDGTVRSGIARFLP